MQQSFLGNFLAIGHYACEWKDMGSCTDLLDVADDGSLGHLSNGLNVANAQRCLLTGVDELTAVHALSSDEQRLLVLVPHWVAESHLSMSMSNQLIGSALQRLWAVSKGTWHTLGANLCHTGVGTYQFSKSDL